jgi:hypothetical protein
MICSLENVRCKTCGRQGSLFVPFMVVARLSTSRETGVESTAPALSTILRHLLARLTARCPTCDT